MEEQRYTSGFNAGYSIQQREPKILRIMLKGMTKETPYKQGLRDGGKQFEKEQLRDKLKQQSKAQEIDNQKGR